MSDNGNNNESAATRGLSAEDVEDFKEAFDNFDQDKNGSIDSTELATVLRSLGYTPTQVQLKKVMDKVRALTTRATHFVLRFGPTERNSFILRNDLNTTVYRVSTLSPVYWISGPTALFLRTLDTIKAR